MTHFRLLRPFMMAGLFSLAHLTFAQSTTLTNLDGGRHDGPGRFIDSNATFKLGMTTDSGATYITSARLADTVQIRGEIEPEAINLNQLADIFVVDRLSATSFRMRTQGGVWQTWNGSVSALIPFMEDVPLTSSLSVSMFTGTLGTVGNHRLFLGYLPPDGILRYHVNALSLTITEETALEQANALFASKISPNIVQTNCIACHSSGGSASGLAIHTFVAGSGSTQLATNFSQFSNLFAARGSALILSKVVGGSGHGGSAVMSSTSQEYRDLEQFLTLLGQL